VESGRRAALYGISAEVGADGGTVFWGGNSLCIARGPIAHQVLRLPAAIW